MNTAKKYLSNEIMFPSYYDILSDTSKNKNEVVISVLYKKQEIIVPLQIIKYIGLEPMSYAPLLGLGIGLTIDYFIFRYIQKSLKGFNPGGPNKGE